MGTDAAHALAEAGGGEGTAVTGAAVAEGVAEGSSYLYQMAVVPGRPVVPATIT